MRLPKAWSLLLPLLLLGGGCGDTPWRSLAEAVLPEHAAGSEETEEAAAAAPAEGTGRALRLTLGRRTARARLLQELGERRLWRTGANFVVATDGPRVVATSGWREVLAATRFDGPDPLANPLLLVERSATARRLVDLMTADRDPAGMRFGLEIECRLHARPVEEAPGVLLVEERCHGEGIGGGFTNRFWVEAAEGGALLRSEQWIGPGLPPLVLEPLRPAS